MQLVNPTIALELPLVSFQELLSPWLIVIPNNMSSFVVHIRIFKSEKLSNTEDFLNEQR